MLVLVIGDDGWGVEGIGLPLRTMLGKFLARLTTPPYALLAFSRRVGGRIDSVYGAQVPNLVALALAAGTAFM